MIVNENITTYIHSLESDNPGWLEKIREEADATDVPVIRREMESFIRVLLSMKQPHSILEIGTATGYSSLLMALFRNGEGDGLTIRTRITTIENYEPRLIKARNNLSGRPDITLIEGDACEVIKELGDPFDMIFLDGPKGQYIHMLPDLKRLLRSGAVLLADNVLQDGELVRSRYLIPRRQRTIHERMREFIYEVKHDPDLQSSLITIGDGVILSIKK